MIERYSGTMLNPDTMNDTQDVSERDGGENDDVNPVENEVPIVYSEKLPNIWDRITMGFVTGFVEF